MKMSASTSAGDNNCCRATPSAALRIDHECNALAYAGRHIARGLKSPLSIGFVAGGASQEIIWASRRPLPAKRALRPQSVSPILKHLNFFDRNQSALHHSIQDRQKPIDLLLRVDDLDDYW